LIQQALRLNVYVDQTPLTWINQCRGNNIILYEARETHELSARLEAEVIEILDRIVVGITVRIDAAVEPDRVCFNVPSRCRVIISEVVVM
jgi:hypothetical protein